MKRGSQPSFYYPIFLDLSGRKCVVVGGGPVALRKAKALMEHGGNVQVISPDLCPELARMVEKGTIQVTQKGYESGGLEGAFIVIAATDDKEINSRVAREAGERGVLVNVVDDPKHSDFIVPSYLRRGPLTIAISTAGRSPALARKIRTLLEEEIGAEYASLALMIGEVRSELRERGIIVDGDSWQEAIDLDLLKGMLRAGQNKEAKATLLGNIERLRGTETGGGAN